VYSHTKNFSDDFWIGLRYINTTYAQWAWSNGEQLNFTKWKKGEPNSIREEHCAEIIKNVKVWNNLPCHRELAWICEKPKTVKRPGPLATGKYCSTSI
jgi:endonuclease I